MSIPPHPSCVCVEDRRAAKPSRPIPNGTEDVNDSWTTRGSNIYRALHRGGGYRGHHDWHRMYELAAKLRLSLLCDRKLPDNCGDGLRN